MEIPKAEELFFDDEMETLAPFVEGLPLIEKACPNCKKTKPLTEFYWQGFQCHDDGFSGYCKICHTESSNKTKTARAARYTAINWARDPQAQPGTKRCRKCRTDFPRTEFLIERARRDGLTSQCRFCINGRRRESDRADKYGIPTETFRTLLKLPENQKCFICGKAPNYTLHIDHNHTTEQVRGFLCHSCNQAMSSVDFAGVNVVVERLARYAKLSLPEQKALFDKLT